MSGKILKKKKINTSVLDLAYERINRAFDLYDTISVSFSGGKDSTACLNLTLEVAKQRKKLPLRVFFHDEEAIPYQTEEYARRVASNPDIAFEWYCLPVKHRNACSRKSPWWSPWDPAESDLWVRSLPPEGITHLKGFRVDGEPRDRLSIPDTNGLLHDPFEHGTAGMIMGIRGQESLIRNNSVSRRKEENYLIHLTNGTSKGNIWKVYPIYDWLTEDVWTAPEKFEWDYNHAYDVMEQYGIPLYGQRCSPAYGEEPLQKFRNYKTCFPEIWDKMSTRVPGANTAMLYSQTELWGYGKLVEKPVDVEWSDFIVHYIQKFSSQEASLVASNVRTLINQHYNKTTDPIVEKAAHPITGISWKGILSIAMRGDFKGRRTNTMSSKAASCIGKDIDQAWKEYNEARTLEGL